MSRLSPPPKSLDIWLTKRPETEFPGYGKSDYPTQYKLVSKYLNEHVHPHVAVGALMKNDGFLTDHGPDHIKTVIDRATAIVGTNILNSYEVYLLLMAAHFHDVGNIYGRERHEKKSKDILKEISLLMGDDAAEKRTILSIAEAHGGKVDEDKDTISRLPETDAVLNHTVRVQFLAAVLRLADELSDDTHRAARFPMKLKIIPKSSQIYHQYARALQSVIVTVEDRRIGLHFDLTKDIACKTFGKHKARVFLLDEIYERTMKVHLERLYCQRFMASEVRLDSVNVEIKVFPTESHPTPVEKISYRLAETGYPQTPCAEIRNMCPDLRWTGESLKEQLSSLGKK